MRKEVEEKIEAASNKVAALYYKDENSIATIKEEIDTASTIKNRKSLFR